MDWKQRCRERLPAHLDAQGDLVPPWAKFPTYERYTLGWRMGHGEDWLGMFGVFLEQLGPAFEARLAYLRRHPAAPISWANTVSRILYPAQAEQADAEEDDDDDGAAEAAAASKRRAELRELGLVASDVAYTTWLHQQDGVRWPWQYAETPEDAARHWTRDLSFWSRQVAGLRGAAWEPPAVPEEWQSCAAPLVTGDAAPLALERGLLSLARMLAAGHVTPPWQLGLTLADFADSFDDDMGYVDAFRLWGMSVFDDREHVERYLDATRMPPEWRGWIIEQWSID